MKTATKETERALTVAEAMNQLASPSTLGWEIQPGTGYLCDWCGSECTHYELRGPKTMRACGSVCAAELHVAEGLPGPRREW